MTVYYIQFRSPTPNTEEVIKMLWTLSLRVNTRNHQVDGAKYALIFDYLPKLLYYHQMIIVIAN